MSYFLFKALVRDGFRCVITGHFDYNSAQKNKELKQERDSNNIDMCHTECAHIFPESTNAKISGDGGADKVCFFSHLLRCLSIYLSSKPG